MRFCPLKWDFGVRYLDRDLPPEVYDRFRALVFVTNLAELEARRAAAEAWGAQLVRELDMPASGR